MAIHNVRQAGFGTAAAAVINMIGDLTAAGMRLVYPNNIYGPIPPTEMDNMHTTTGFLKTTTRINFDGDAYFPVGRFILESTKDIDVKAVISKTAVTVTFSGTIASNSDGTSTLTVTTPPASLPSPQLAVGMTVNLVASGTTTTTTTTAAPGGTTTTAAPVISAGARILSGSGTTWIVTGTAPITVATALTATDAYTSLSDSTVLTEGWRICFDFPFQYLEDYAITTVNSTTKKRTGGLINKEAVPSTPTAETKYTIFDDFLAVYVGTSVQLRNDGQISILPDVRTVGNAVKVTYIQPDGLIGSWYRIPGYNSVTSKTIGLLPPITVMKATINMPPGPGTPALNTSKRLGANITANMTLTGGEIGSDGKNYRLLPYTYINEDPFTIADMFVSGTGLGDSGTYYVAVTAGYTGYSMYQNFAPTGSNGIKVIGVSGEINGADVGFINRLNLDQLSGLALPLTYEITMTQKGLFIGVWDVLSEENGRRFNWLLVQRSVDRVSGAIRAQTKTTQTGAVATFLDSTEDSVAPVFCVNGVNNLYYQFTVREADQGGPSIPKTASANTEDNSAIINPFDQQSITDEGKYVITFLNKLNSPRHRYADELDMVGTVSSDVIGFGTEVRISAYGEEMGTPGLQRVYRALPSNNPYGTGMRLMVLTGWETTENGVGKPGTPYTNGPQSETPPPVTTTTTTTAATTTTTTTPAPI
jgi:hypothetical protein